MFICKTYIPSFALPLKNVKCIFMNDCLYRVFYLLCSNGRVYALHPHAYLYFCSTMRDLFHFPISICIHALRYSTDERAAKILINTHISRPFLDGGAVIFFPRRPSFYNLLVNIKYGTYIICCVFRVRSRIRYSIVLCIAKAFDK